MNNTKEHQALADKILLEFGSKKNIRLWKRQVGLFRYLFNEAKIYIGIKGESDLDGIIAPYGKKLSIEVKTGAGKLNPDQIKYKEMIEKFGGVYIEARSIQDVLTGLSKYL